MRDAHRRPPDGRQPGLRGGAGPRGCAVAPRDPAAAAAAAADEARAIHAEEEAASEAQARHGADLLAGRRARRILTHCNTGALAAPGRGTALAPIAELAARGQLELVLACETRPLLQGARLTVWELAASGSTMNCSSTAPPPG